MIITTKVTISRKCNVSILIINIIIRNSVNLALGKILWCDQGFRKHRYPGSSSKAIVQKAFYQKHNTTHFSRKTRSWKIKDMIFLESPILVVKLYFITI